MIEFTLSRVCLSVCGLVLLAAVIAPVTGIYESKTVRMESNISADIAEMINDLYYSEMDVLTISMSDVLPSASSYIEFNGHMIVLTTERGVYKSGTDIAVIADVPFGYGDILRLTKNGDTIIAERLA